LQKGNKRGRWGTSLLTEKRRGEKTGEVVHLFEGRRRRPEKEGQGQRPFSERKKTKNNVLHPQTGPEEGRKDFFKKRAQKKGLCRFKASFLV